MTAIWLAQADLENATSVATVAAVFDDQNNGSLNASAIAAVIDRGEQEVLSWLVTEIGPPPLSPTTLTSLATDNFLKYAALEYAVAHMFDRHPEYVRANGKERGERFTRADTRMQRVLDARQRPPTFPTPPANVGGAVTDGASRLVIDQPGEPAGSNAGDF